MDYKQSTKHIVRVQNKYTLILLVCICFVLFIFSPLFIQAQSVLRESESVSITAIVTDTNNNGNTGNSGNTNGGGGGGGGGGSGATYSNPVTVDATGDNVIFKGLAYPGSIVSLLKNGVIVAEVPASPDATFHISLSGLLANTYNFSLRAQDSDGRFSPTQLYTIELQSGVTTLVSGIMFSPTVSIDNTEVKRGDTLTVFGRASPQATVTTVFNSSTNLIKKTVSDSDGNWVYKLDTLELAYGDHQVKARSETDTDITEFSPSLSFKVGDFNKKAPDIKVVKTIPAGIDLSGDSKIDIADYSILAYWYSRQNPPAKIDLNHDGKITLADFSILAYYWTG